MGVGKEGIEVGCRQAPYSRGRGNGAGAAAGRTTSDRTSATSSVERQEGESGTTSLADTLA